MEFHEDENRLKQRRHAIDRPTQTLFDSLGPKSIPARPKIVVLGATGRIGRQVVKQLLEIKGIDMTVVAFVREYDKAIRVLYDDMMVVSRGGGGGQSSSNSEELPSRNKNSPKLQIVVGNLVPPEELPGFVEDEAEEEQVWMEKADSASRFYGNKVQDYDNRKMLPGINEALEEAIRDSTTIISCVGDVRPTNLWTDILVCPLIRLLNPDVSSWCRDGRHPYYVHYASTRKALGFAEREQLRRQAAAATLAETEGISVEEVFVPRIRFIRISDLCVSHQPWHFVPLVTNIMRSVVFRYQEMAERLLQDSPLLDTVIIRPGDLVDEERDGNTTWIQVCSSGKVPSPARVGREDVASLVVAAATFLAQNKTHVNGKDGSRGGAFEPFHYTFGCRWVGQELDPYPPQGHKSHGHEDAAMAFQKSLKTLHRTERSASQRQLVKGKSSLSSKVSSSSDVFLGMAQKLAEKRHGRRKPHGICVAVPVYLFLLLFVKTVLWPCLHYVPGGSKWILPFLNRMNEGITAGLTLFVRQLLIHLPRLGRRRHHGYISF
jgi:hypothetical protein